MNFIKSASLSILLLVATIVWAEEAPRQDPPAETSNDVELGAVTVTVDRGERRKFEVRRSVEILDEDGIAQRQPKSVPDLLDETPGVMVQKTNAGAGAPVLRGLVGPDNLILMDGIRISNSTYRTGPNQYLAMIDPWSLRAFELLRGPGSVLYGSDAMGGVLHAITKDPRRLSERAWGLSGRLSFASAYPGLGGSIQGDFRDGDYAGYLGATFDHFGEVRAGGNIIQPLSSYQRAAVRHKSVVELAPGYQLTAAVFETSIRNAGRADQLNLGKHSTYDNDDLLAYVRLDRIGEGWQHRFRVNLSYHLTNELESGVRCARTGDVVADRAACLAAQPDQLTRRTEMQDTVHTPGLFATLESRSWDNRMRTIVGAEGYFDYVDSSARVAKPDGWDWQDGERGHFSAGSTYASLGTFLRGELDLIKSDKSTVTADAGTRLSYFAAHAPDVPGLGNVDYSHAGLIGSAGIGYQYAQLLHLYADFSQGFRAANLQETTEMGDTGIFFEVPNDGLRPIRSDTLELGMKLNAPHFHLGISGWYSKLTDLYGREVLTVAEIADLGLDEGLLSGQTVVRRINHASGDYRGVDLTLESRRFSGFSAYGAVSWIDGNVEDEPGRFVSPRRLPPVAGSAGLRYETPGGDIYGEFFIRWAAAQSNLNPEDEADYRICEDPDRPGQLLDDCQGTPGWATLNWRAGLLVTPNLALDLRIENLGDTHYRVHGSGIDAPGFNGMVELRGTY